MLCLRIKRGERIILRDDIIIEALHVGQNTVQLGIIAPQIIPIAREKIFKKNHPEIQLPPAKKEM